MVLQGAVLISVLELAVLTPCCAASARDPAELERVVNTNVFGAFATIQAFYPLLKVRCISISIVHPSRRDRRCSRLF